MLSQKSDELASNAAFAVAEQQRIKDELRAQLDNVRLQLDELQAEKVSAEEEAQGMARELETKLHAEQVHTSRCLFVPLFDCT